MTCSSDQSSVFLHRNWHHVAFVRDAAGLGSLYIDGTLVGSESGMALGFDSETPWFIGRGAADVSNVPYALDSVQIRREALDQNGIATLLFNADSDGNGLPDAWEFEYFGAKGIDPAGMIMGSGISVLAAYEQGLNPLDFSTDAPPALRIFGGGNQRGLPGSTLPEPLAIELTCGDFNAPLAFEVTDGNAQLSAVSDAATPPCGTLALPPAEQFIDAQGNKHYVARVFIHLASTASDISQITVTATVGGQTASVVTTAVATDPDLCPPTDLAATPTSPTSMQLVWNAWDATQPTTVQISRDGGATWIDLGAVAAGAATATVTGLLPDQEVLFRLYTGGAYTGAGNTLDAGAAGGSASATPTPLAQQQLMAPAASQNSVANPSAGSIAGPSANGEPLGKPHLWVEAAGSALPWSGWQGGVNPAMHYLHMHYEPGTLDANGFVPWPGISRDFQCFEDDFNLCTCSFISPHPEWGDPIWWDWPGHMGSEGFFGETLTTQICGSTVVFGFMTQPYSLSDFISHAESRISVFKNNFQEVPVWNFDDTAFRHCSYDGTPPLYPNGGLTLYSVQLLHYKWKVNSDPNGVVLWDEVFQPDDGSPLIHKIKTWQTQGNTESDIYPIDPRTANGGKYGTYWVSPLPVNLIDLNGAPLDSSSNVVISPKTSDDDQNPQSIAWIDPHRANNGPDMPQLVLRIKGTETMGLNIQWQLHVQYDRPNGQWIPTDYVTIPDPAISSDSWETEPLTGAVKIYDNIDWGAELINNGFCGGRAWVTYQILDANNSPITSPQTILFNIGGKNPDDGICEQYINQEAANTDSHLWFSYAIGKHESKDYNGEGSIYNQFWETHGNRFGAEHFQGDPLWCKAPSEVSAGGFGIFQITGDATHGQNYTIPRDRLWNWETNADAYFGIMKTEGSSSKMSVASRFFDAISGYYPTPPYEVPPSDCTNLANVWYNMSAYDADIITLYNGAGGSAKTALTYPDGSQKTFYNPWKFYPNNASGWKWYYYIDTSVNSNDYLQNIINQFN